VNLTIKIKYLLASCVQVLHLSTLLTLEDYSKHYKDLEKFIFCKTGIHKTVSGENERKLQYAFCYFVLRKLPLLTGQGQTNSNS